MIVDKKSVLIRKIINHTEFLNDIIMSFNQDVLLHERDLTIDDILALHKELRETDDLILYVLETLIETEDALQSSLERSQTMGKTLNNRCD